MIERVCDQHQLIKHSLYFILPKINKAPISEPNFTKSEGKVRLGQNEIENDPLDEPKKMPLSKNVYLFGNLVKNAKW